MYYFIPKRFFERVGTAIAYTPEAAQDLAQDLGRQQATKEEYDQFILDQDAARELSRQYTMTQLRAWAKEHKQ
jgi:hypothetical protein